jgi:hypothetical protein
MRFAGNPQNVRIAAGVVRVTADPMKVFKIEQRPPSSGS